MQIQRNCTTESNQLIGSIQSEERFEGKTTHKGEETRRPPRKVVMEYTGVADISRETQALRTTTVLEVGQKSRTPQRTPAPCKKSEGYQYNNRTKNHSMGVSQGG